MDVMWLWVIIPGALLVGGIIGACMNSTDETVHLGKYKQLPVDAKLRFKIKKKKYDLTLHIEERPKPSTSSSSGTTAAVVAGAVIGGSVF